MRNKGQSTVEYVLLVTAVLSVVIILCVRENSPFQQRLRNTINLTTDGMQNMAVKLTNITKLP